MVWFIIGLISCSCGLDIYLAPSSASADSSTIDTLKTSVPVSCYLSGTVSPSHVDTLPVGTYHTDIGKTTLRLY